MPTPPPPEHLAVHARPPAPRRRPGWALAALLAGATGIAFAPIFVRMAETGPVATAFWRLLLALPILFAWARRVQAGSTPPQPKRWALLAATGVAFAGDLGFWHVSIQATSVANSTFLVNLAPVFVAIGAAMLFGERIRSLFVLALALALSGAALLVGANLGGHAALYGDALALVAAVFYAAYQLCVKHLRGHLSAPQILAGSGVAAALALGAVAVSLGEPLLPVSWRGWAILVASALVCQVAGQTLITYAVAHLQASLSSISLLLQPVMATLFAWLLFGELFSPWQWLGGLLVLTGIWLARRASNG